MNRKGFLPIVILLIVVGVLAIGGIGYYFTRKPSMPQPLPELGLFQDHVYGIEVQYPVGWHLAASVEAGDLDDQFISASSSNYSVRIQPGTTAIPMGESGITIYRTSSVLNEALQDDIITGDYLFTPTSTITVDGVVGLKISYNHIVSVQGDVGAGARRTAVYLPYNGFTYGIIFDSRENPIPSSTFDKFLASFKFILPNAK